jgi:hypothetical protein
MIAQALSVVVFVLAALTAVGCGGVTEPAKNNVENFSGTLQPGGNWLQTVTVNNGGEYSVKITALSPTPTAVLLLIWAQGANCEIPQNSGYAQLNQSALFGPILQKGAYCVAVSDPGLLTVAQNFTLAVSHP